MIQLVPFLNVRDDFRCKSYCTSLHRYSFPLRWNTELFATFHTVYINEREESGYQEPEAPHSTPHAFLSHSLSTSGECRTIGLAQRVHQCPILSDLVSRTYRGVKCDINKPCCKYKHRLGMRIGRCCLVQYLAQCFH